MTIDELLKKYEDSKPQNKCKKCVWGKTIVDNKKYNILTIMCMFPKCIKEKSNK